MAATKYYNPISGQWEYILKGAPGKDGLAGPPGSPGAAGSNGINSVVAGGGITIDSTDPANPVIASRPSYITTNSAEDVGKWTKLASVSIYSRFESSVTRIAILGFADGAEYLTSATVYFRVKQNAVMGQPPSVQIQLTDNYLINTNDFTAVTVVNDAGSTVVELYGRIREYYQAWGMYPIGETVIAGTEFFSTQPLLASLPAGAQSYCVYKGGTFSNVSSLSNITAGSGTDPSASSSVYISKSDGQLWGISHISNGSLLFYHDDGAEGYVNTMTLTSDGWLSATNLSGTNTGDQWLGGKQDAQPNEVLRNYDLVGFERNAIDTGYTDKLAFFPLAQLLVEKSSDGGATWTTDTSVSNYNRRSMFSGNNDGPWLDTDYCWRFTFDAYANILMQSERYVTIDTLYMYTETDGDDITVLVERALKDTPTVFGTVVAPTTNMNTWPGHVAIKHDSLNWGGGPTQHNTRYMRVTFTPHKVSATSFLLANMRWYGGDTFNANYQVIKTGSSFVYNTDGSTMTTTHLYPKNTLTYTLGTSWSYWNAVYSPVHYFDAGTYLDGSGGGSLRLVSGAETELKLGVSKDTEGRTELVFSKGVPGTYWSAAYRKGSEGSEFWIYNYHDDVFTNSLRLTKAGDMYITGTMNLNTVSAEPSAAGVGSMRAYAKSIAGKTVLKTVGNAGLDTPLQNALWQNNIVIWQPTAAVAGLWVGTAGAGTGTYSTALPTTTSLYTAMKRARFANVVTTLNQVLGQRATEAAYILSPTVAGQGGFFFYTRCGFDVWTDGSRFFAGMHTSTSVISANPSTANNTVGFAVDDSDAGAIYFQTRATGTTTRVATGFTITSGSGYDLYINCFPGTKVYYWRIVEINTGSEASGTATATPPANNTMAMPGVLASNAALTTVTATQLGLNRIYVETDR